MMRIHNYSHCYCKTPNKTSTPECYMIFPLMVAVCVRFCAHTLSEAASDSRSPWACRINLLSICQVQNHRRIAFSASRIGFIPYFRSLSVIQGEVTIFKTQDGWINNQKVLRGHCIRSGPLSVHHTNATDQNKTISHASSGTSYHPSVNMERHFSCSTSQRHHPPATLP